MAVTATYIWYSCTVIHCLFWSRTDDRDPKMTQNATFEHLSSHFSPSLPKIGRKCWVFFSILPVTPTIYTRSIYISNNLKPWDIKSRLTSTRRKPAVAHRQFDDVDPHNLQRGNCCRESLYISCKLKNPVVDSFWFPTSTLFFFFFAGIFQFNSGHVRVTGRESVRSIDRRKWVESTIKNASFNPIISLV
jgi:hypothetical protein